MSLLETLKQALGFVENLKVPQDVVQVFFQLQEGEKVIFNLRAASAAIRKEISK